MNSHTASFIPEVTTEKKTFVKLLVDTSGQMLISATVSVWLICTGYWTEVHFATSLQSLVEMRFTLLHILIILIAVSELW